MTQDTSAASNRAASYTYGQPAGSFTPGLSSERSTASPSQITGQQQFWKSNPTRHQYSPPSTLPQIQSPSNPPHHPHATMLPPLRLNTQNSRIESRLDPRPSTAILEPSTPKPLASPLSHAPGMGYYPYPMSYHPSHHSYPHNPPHSQAHGYPGMPPDSASSTSTPEIFTPVSADSDYAFYPQQHMQGTIQPSVFSPWQAQQHQQLQSQGQDRRGSPGSGVAAGGADARWGGKSPAGERGDGSGDSSEDEVPRQITYTTEAEVKQTPTIKRECHNCTSRNPPSWRKSILSPGRILCNKCGIFERTHHRSRPPQNDDQKLRKASDPSSTFGGAGPAGAYGAGRSGRAAPPPALQKMSMTSGSGSPSSPFSGGQSTPMSASFTYPPMYSPAPPSSTSEYPPLSSYLQRPDSAQAQLQNLTIPSPSFSSLAPNDLNGTPASSESGTNRFYSHAHSASSPYAHAYASRRGYAPPSRGSVGSIGGASAGSVAQSPVVGYTSPVAGPGEGGVAPWHGRRLSYGTDGRDGTDGMAP
ncbi:hypothetical protein IAR50_006964 [Cryptococcus sp. DSM 104548]